MARFVWLFILLCSGFVFAQPAVEWERQILNTELFHGFCAAQTGDGGYFFGGRTDDLPHQSVLAKLAPTGSISYVRPYAETNWMYSVVPTSDNGFVWLDYWDLAMVKTDNQGEVLWHRPWTFMQPDSLIYSYMNGIGLPNGDVMVSGGCYNQTYPMRGSWPFLFRISAEGDSLSCRSYRDLVNTDSTQIVQASDGGFLLIGTTVQRNQTDSARAIAIKTDSLGNIVWSRTYGDDDGRFMCGSATPDGGFFLAGGIHGWRWSMHSLYLVRTDANGDTLWTREHIDGQMFVPLHIVQTWDHNYVIAAAQQADSANEMSLWLGKFDQEGSLIWHMTCDAVPYLWAISFSLSITADGGYLATCPGPWLSADGGPFIIKLSPDHPQGRQFVDRTSLSFTVLAGQDSVSAPVTIQSTGSHPLRIASLTTSARWFTVSARGPFWLDPGTDTTVWVTCHRHEGPGDLSGSFWILSNDSLSGGSARMMRLEVVRIDASTGETSSPPFQFRLHTAYPNPFNPTTTITFDLPKSEFVTLTVFDLLGRAVAELCHDTYAAGSHTLSFDGGGLPSGIYLYRIHAGGFSASQKMMLLK
jgi:hypothetical protein